MSKEVSVIIPFAEYQSLLELATTVDETTFLLREPNGSILRQCIDDVKHGRNVQERELLPDDPRFPGIIYRYGASDVATPVLRGTGLRVQTLAIDVHQAGMTPAEVAAEYDLPEACVVEALAFYAAHQAEIDAQIAAEASDVVRNTISTPQQETHGSRILRILEEEGLIGCMEGDSNLSVDYKNHLFWPLEEPSSVSFKQRLTSMPQVGKDADFARIQDLGRKDEQWDS